MKNSNLAQLKSELLPILKARAFFREKIRLSSGKESDFYIDARRVTLSPAGANLCARIILEMFKNEKMDAIGGPTLGADPIVGAVAALSYEMGKPVNAFIVRKAPKPYGKQQQIEGPLLQEGDHIVLFDDVVTTGKSIVQSIDVLSAMNLKAAKAVCIVDRKEGAREILAQKGCELIAIFTIDDILN